MSRWTEPFKSHGIHGDLARLNEVLNSAELPKSIDLPQTEELARLRKIVAYITGIVENMDPEIVNPQLLTNMQSYVQSAAAEAAQYYANGNIGHLQNANSNADQVLAFAIQSPFVAFGSTKASLTKAATAYVDAMEGYATRYDARMQELAGSTEGSFSAIDEKMLAANELMSKLDTRIAAMEAALPTQLSSYNTTFQASEAMRAERYETWASKYQEKLDTQFTEVAAKNAVGLEVMNSLQDKAQKVLGTVVDTAQAGAYATYATAEKRNANLFRFLALSSMAAAALVLFIPEIVNFLKLATGYTVNWQAALYRLPFSLILFAPALYLAKESSKHRTNEVANRRRQHILTTIGPYLALLEPKKAEEIKADVAKSIFSDNLPVIDEKSSDAGNVVAQLSNLVAMILKQKK